MRRDFLKVIYSSSLCFEQAHLQKKPAQNSIQPDLEPLQRWDVHNFSGRHVPVFHHSHCKKNNSYKYSKSSHLQFKAITISPTTTGPAKKLLPIFLISSFQVLKAHKFSSYRIGIVVGWEGTGQYDSLWGFSPCGCQFCSIYLWALSGSPLPTGEDILHLRHSGWCNFSAPISSGLAMIRELENSHLTGQGWILYSQPSREK